MFQLKHVSIEYNADLFSICVPRPRRCWSLFYLLQPPRSWPQLQGRELESNTISRFSVLWNSDGAWCPWYGASWCLVWWKVWVLMPAALCSSLINGWAHLHSTLGGTEIVKYSKTKKWNRDFFETSKAKLVLNLQSLVQQALKLKDAHVKKPSTEHNKKIKSKYKSFQ